MSATPIALLRKRVEAWRALPAPAMRKALRQEAGLSLADVADAVGVSKECIRLWELGLRQPSERHLRRYLRVIETLRGSS